MDPSTASRAPSTFLASATASTGRSSALLGTQPQYEHSPPTSSRSTTATDSPAARLRSVTFCPTGPAPITMTSYVSSIVGFLPLDYRKVVDRGDKLGAWRGRRRVSGGRDMEFRELAAFVAIVEEGGLSAASRRLHISQPALSQTVNNLERELAVKLLVRSSTGVQPTEAGITLLAEARAVLARRDQALATMAELTTDGGSVIRLGIPLELDPDVLPRALARFTAKFPETRVVPRQLSTAAQFAALRDDTLDVGLVRERPAGPEFDAMLVSRENLGILIASDVADELVGPDGVRLDALHGLKWVGFPRTGSPAWFDELTSILRSHGVDIGPPVPEDLELIVAMKFASVSSGHAFALAPPRRLDQLPEAVAWAPLVGNPLVRRTWAVWLASSRRRDVGHFVTTFDSPDDG